MPTMEVTIPNVLFKFDKIKKERILLGAIRHVVIAELKEEKKESERALRTIKKYEKKYKMSNIEEFEKNMSKDGDYKLHEDWIDWSFWNDVYHRTQKDVHKLQKLVGDV